MRPFGMPANAQSVSVIIPAYNEASRIGAAIESVLAQTAAATEIIVVDDGSTDGTAEVAGAYPVSVVRQANRGISAARNRAFREATGTWLALLDADDLWEPERLAWLARATSGRPEIAFGFSDYTVEEAGVANAPSNLARTPQYLGAGREPVTDGVVAIERGALCAALAVGNFLGTSTVFIRRDLVARHALYFDETLPLRTADYQLSEDVEWYLRVLKWSDALAIDRILARYVRRPNSQAEAYGRVRFGDVKLGERIAADPGAYAPGASSEFARMRRHHLRHAAQIHMRAADFAAARAILVVAQRERYVPSDALRLAAAIAADCDAGRRLTRTARSAWQRALRPLLRSLRLRRGRA
jgi:glycosyltransferase involved in cell wall biosynthesis